MLTADGPVGPAGPGGADDTPSADGVDALRQRARDFLAGHDPGTLPRLDFLRARRRP